MLYTMLDIALDMGITEANFWDMTIAEVKRSVASWRRRKHTEEQEQAAHNYILAGLISRNLTAMLSEDVEMLSLEEAYPTLFEEKAQEKKRTKEDAITELSCIRFKQFANSHNNRFKQEVANKSE